MIARTHFFSRIRSGRCWSDSVRIRTLLLAAAMAAFGFYCWLAFLTFSARTEPGAYHPLTLGPPADVLEQAAAARLEQGLAALNDRSNPPAARLQSYHEQLAAADDLLVRSLRANPESARALASLAAVRWELHSPLSEEDTVGLLNMIATASRMADASPRTQIQLGEVLLKMGRSEEGLAYIARAVELDSGMSSRAIEILRDQNLPAAEIAGALPRKAEVLSELRLLFLEDGDILTYLDVLEGTFVDSPEILSRELLVAYGNSCLLEQAADRLLRSLMTLQEAEDDALEASRLLQISRAHLGLDDFSSAIRVIERAIALQPRAAYLRVQLGDSILASDDPGAAIDAYRNALGILAWESGSPLLRATIYRKIGQAEERRGDMDRAYDAYTMALELNPDEAHAGRRLREMSDAAGFAPS
jgi:tetratricopeptide (TPR) repeat protein